MDMIVDSLRYGCVVLMGVALVAAAGCASTSGGGGGGDGTTGDPLAEYQLGDSAELDADVAAITNAYNAAVACVNDNASFTDEQNLDALKQAYTGAPEDFPAYVDQTRTQIEQRTDEICTTNLGDNPDLDAQVAELTTQRNRGRQCRGDEPNLTDENTLGYLKQQYLQRILVFDDLLSAAEQLVIEATQAADLECSQQ
jgi:hypothetical protein